MTTRKKTSLKVVRVPQEPEPPSMTEPPSALSDAAKAWWRGTVAEYELEPHHLRLLSEAAFAWDRAQQARALVDAEGIVVRDRFGQEKPHVGIAVERDARGLYVRICRELDLDGASPEESRPPRASRNRP